MQHRIHLVASTVGRPESLAVMLDTLDVQGVPWFITLVEQAAAPTCRELLEPYVERGDARYVHEPVVRGLSRGRNVGLEDIRAEVVLLADDDCVYPPGLFRAVLARFDADDGVDGVGIRLVDEDGRGVLLRWLPRACRLTRWRVPRAVTSQTLFFRRTVVERVGPFDVTLGVGAGTPFGAGEETDWVLRALRLGARIAYVPELTLLHEEWRDDPAEPVVRDKIRRYNRGFGRVMRLHRQWAAFGYWGGRSVLGAAVRALQGDRRAAGRQWEQLRGRTAGFLAPVGDDASRGLPGRPGRATDP